MVATIILHIDDVCLHHWNLVTKIIQDKDVFLTECDLSLSAGPDRHHSDSLAEEGAGIDGYFSGYVEHIRAAAVRVLEGGVASMRNNGPATWLSCTVLIQVYPGRERKMPTLAS